jgi:hypothetical protein
VTRNENNWGYEICGISPYWAGEPLVAIVVKVDVQHNVRTVVIDSIFGVNRSRGFQSAVPRKSTFPIESFHRLYNIALR